ncbi:MAG: 6-phosphogluconolactonase [Pseudohongiellaceae bacterium]|nr:6-phosphogluconolactonase [Pseudohongiellaceae bacterium]
MSIEFNAFDSNAELVKILATEISETLHSKIAKRGRASLAVSGGSTPLLLFKELSAIEIAWERVCITLVDERWVEPDHQDSNEKLLRENLLQDKAAKANFFPLKLAGLSPSSAVRPLSDELKDKVLPLDAVVLGMGEDGHTASFFAGAPQLSEALSLTDTTVCARVVPPSAPHERMTLTLGTLLNSQRLFLHFVGSKKREVFEKAQVQVDVNVYPVSAVLCRPEYCVEVYYADQ